MSEASADQPAKAPVYVPRWIVRTIWIAHRTAYRVTGGRFGLRPSTTSQWGMLRLHTIGRHTGKEGIAILGYIEDGANIVIPAMNGWADPEPAWWLNLQSQPDALIELPDGPRQVTARASVGEDRAARITGEDAGPHDQALGYAKRFAKQAEDMFDVLEVRREAIRHDKIEYTRPEIRVTIDSVDRAGATLTVKASERTKLHFRKVKGDEPEYTAYREDHVFTFAQTADGWVLADQQPADTSELAPITETIDLVATGDPNLDDPDASSTERPAGKLSTDKAGDVAEQGGVTVMAIPPGLDYTAMVTYAVKYWDNYNPAYRSFAGNGGDCTNFISQILRHGGWAFKTGLWTDDNNWWYNALNQTRSWAGAENWSHFAPQRTTHLSNIWQMSKADILQFDFDKDGIMDHSMVVTKKTSSEIYMTYHSVDTLNKPLSELQAKYANSAWWYSYRT